MAEPDYTDEIWKPIPYALTYAVSSHGRLKRLVKGPRGQPPGHILAMSSWSPKRDYPCAHFVTNEGKVVSRRMNRLVLEVFVGPPPRGAVAAHGDGDTMNNGLNNLRWATQKENMDDARQHGTLALGNALPQSRLTPEAVRKIRSSAKLQREIADEFGITQSAVSRVRSGETWGHV